MYNNPFIGCTARDMEYSDVISYWCQPYDYFSGLHEDDLLKSTTPIIIEGARGSGKTMILKHLSYYCQKHTENADRKSNLIAYFSEIGTLGVYYRFKNDFGKLLASLNCSQEMKDDVFSEYFNLYYTRELLTVINDLVNNLYLTNETVAKMQHALITEFNTPLESVDESIIYINTRIELIDQFIQQIKYIGDVESAFSGTVLKKGYLQKLLRIIRAIIPEWSSLKLAILIDEYENISAFHKIVNTYIKQTDSNLGITYRIGVRPSGITTYSTLIGKESLQASRDYILLRLHAANPKKYQAFLKSVANKRLENEPFFLSNNLTKIENILGRREDWEAEASQAAKARPQIAFDCIDPTVSNKFGREKIIKELAYPRNPLIEMLNVLWINRGKTVDDTKSAMAEYLLAKEHHQLKHLTGLGKKYYYDYDMKYKYSLLFVLLSKCGIRKKYYSFTTFSYLSSGSVNDFLSLCRNTFMAFDKRSYNYLLSGKPIPAETQDFGAREAASEHLDKIRLCEDSGTEMYTFSMNVGEVFGYYHRNVALQFPETNQFAFENEADINKHALLNRYLGYMIKWGVIEKKTNMQHISIGRRKGTLYSLNRMLSPIFGISYRTRGGYNFVIRAETFERMLSTSMEAEELISLNKTKELLRDSISRPAILNEIDGQISLFEE